MINIHNSYQDIVYEQKMPLPKNKKREIWLKAGKFSTCNKHVFYLFGNHLGLFLISSRWHRLHSCPDGEFIQLRQIQRLFFPVVRWPWKSRKMDKNRVFAVSVLEQNPGRSARVQGVLNCVLTCVMILTNFDKNVDIFLYLQIILYYVYTFQKCVNKCYENMNGLFDFLLVIIYIFRTSN